MRIERSWLEELVFSGEAPRRFTQDSPVLPDVWLTFGREGARDKPLDLLFTPFRQVPPGGLSRRLSEVLGDGHRIAINQAVVAAEVTLAELVRLVVCCSDWWWDFQQGERKLPSGWFAPERRRALAAQLQVLARRQHWTQQLREPGTLRERASRRAEVRLTLPPTLLWFIRLAGTLDLALAAKEPERPVERLAELAWDFDGQIKRFVGMAGRHLAAPRTDGRCFFLVSRNRQAAPALDRSVVTIKADSARRLFEISCAKLTWAVVDSGIDATHPAFRSRTRDGTLEPQRDGSGRLNTRVLRTFDFTRVRQLLDPRGSELRQLLRLKAVSAAQAAKRLRTMLQDGIMIDWNLLIPLLEVPHEGRRYVPPVHDHGTHVAGILAGDWRRKDFRPGDEFYPGDVDLIGVCPDLRLYDLRIFSEDGAGDEFSVMAALQFMRWLNERGDQPALHGVNLSLSIEHDVTNFACGRTPVCVECSRLVGSGVVVVAAAGNEGRAQFQLASGGSSEGYRNMSISDPGNTEEVITVGATHRHQPHTYGVSYFSSRGPTGDGRVKPDLVAPGEKISAPVPGGQGTKDGTSMAAPHVSGAAALLLGRYRELLGDPATVKRILCSTATDLKRERYFQGNGLVDILRALQSV
jgi:serine protease AprX